MLYEMPYHKGRSGSIVSVLLFSDTCIVPHSQCSIYGLLTPCAAEVVPAVPAAKDQSIYACLGRAVRIERSQFLVPAPPLCWDSVASIHRWPSVVIPSTGLRWTSMAGTSGDELERDKHLSTLVVNRAYAVPI